METKEFVKKFEAIMYEPTERFDDVCYVDEYFSEDGVGIEIKVM
jgi:hypothetical protein